MAIAFKARCLVQSHRAIFNCRLSSSFLRIDQLRTAVLRSQITKGRVPRRARLVRVCTRCLKTEPDDVNGEELRSNAAASGDLVEGYDFEELLRNIRNKTSARRQKTLHKAKRDVDNLMNIGELVDFLKAENANDICVISVPPERQYVDYMVVCSGSSSRHIRRMATALAAEMRHVKVTSDYVVKTDHRRVVVEGEESDDWMAVDIGNIVVHFMLTATRDLYQIEKLWCLGSEYDDMTTEMKKYNEQD